MRTNPKWWQLPPTCHQTRLDRGLQRGHQHEQKTNSKVLFCLEFTRQTLTGMDLAKQEFLLLLRLNCGFDSRREHQKSGNM